MKTTNDKVHLKYVDAVHNHSLDEVLINENSGKIIWYLHSRKGETYLKDEISRLFSRNSSLSALDIKLIDIGRMSYKTTERELYGIGNIKKRPDIVWIDKFTDFTLEVSTLIRRAVELIFKSAYENEIDFYLVLNIHKTQFNDYTELFYKERMEIIEAEQKRAKELNH